LKPNKDAAQSAIFFSGNRLKRVLIVSILAHSTFFGASALADATLAYELTGPGAEKAVKTVAIARFWARVDDPAEKGRFLLFQAGKFFPMYRVDEPKETYTLLTKPVTPYLSSQQKTPATREGAGHSADDKQAGAAGHEGIHGTGEEHAAAPHGTQTAEGAGAGAAKPAAVLAHPVLKPTKKTRTVAGIRCRVVVEWVDDKPVVEHCMANTPRLHVTNRELITLARLFEAGRKMNLGLLGIGTKDESFVSVQSRDLRDDRTLRLTSISHEALPSGHLRIPKSYNLETAGDRSVEDR